ncbi:MFS transporter [Streptacidiphilus sp. P02-A3a]|uniref:MFS transporter n=1 Tax=Streptacidiphilus sp. P02-A3a TaxID=2704468 RepID=UPI0015F95F8C|nr:MFS transporter [Streptacidiphilus sp. P02-A3a]QMU71481.1 MFS transporter [Streptacidiphilus sp. P02-A3a]
MTPGQAVGTDDLAGARDHAGPAPGPGGGSRGRRGRHRRRDPRRAVLGATAVACGVSVAGIYYAQPLLPALAAAFGIGRPSAAAIVTAGQIGYAVGLLLLVPLGDVRDRKRLAVVLMLLAAPAAALAALAPTLPVLAAAVAVLGLTGSAAQVLVALTAAGASGAGRGRAVGTVMGGLTAGILLARVFAGTLAELAGWRAVYAAAAVLLAGAALLVQLVLPGSGHPVRLRRPGRRRPGALRAGIHGYGQLLSGTGSLMWRQPLLRRRCGHGFLAFAAFSAFWTPCAYLLSAPPFHYGEAAIGLFGLAGLAGVLFAQPVGRWCDRGHARSAAFGFSALMAASFGVLALGRGQPTALAAGAVLLDLGLRGVQTANQQQIYALLPATTHSRVTTAYMTCYFVGGATGSVLSADLYARTGWSGVCLLGAALAAAPLAPRMLKIIATRGTRASTAPPARRPTEQGGTATGPSTATEPEEAS